MQSLLGQFYSRIKGSQEDIASEGLTYILQRSEAARLAINKVIKADCQINFTELSYRTQKIGENKENRIFPVLILMGRRFLFWRRSFGHH